MAKPAADPTPTNFLAVSLLTDAKQYRLAADILAKSRFNGITSPHYFLIAQSIELFLKAYIVAAGGTRSELTKQKNRHSLAKLFEMASEQGYKSRSEKTEIVVELLGPHHENHSFRYRKIGLKTYPAIADALATLNRMDREISPFIARSISRVPSAT